MARTPFGNPDGARSDIQDVVENFVTFDELRTSTGLDLQADDLSPRVIVGAKGSGKTVYLRRLRAAAAANDSVYTDVVQQDLPATSNVVKFCQCFGPRDLTEKWMQLWYCAIIRSLVSHLLHARALSEYLTEEQREELSGYPPEFVPTYRREVSVYSQITDIIHRHHSGQSFTRYFDDPVWAQLSSTLAEIIVTTPPIYFFIDSVDEEYASAPMYWLQCQKGLFFRAMRFLRDQHFGGRLHVIVCVRDHVLASVLRGEHQNRYRGEPHITTLGWDTTSAEFFLLEKVSRLEPGFRCRPDGAPTVASWLGCSFVENRGRRVKEPILQYLLRHTRLLPRDIVILGNRLCEIVVNAKRSGRSEVSPESLRKVVREVSRSFGNEQLAICGNHLASSGMPTDAARHGYDEIYTGDNEYARDHSDRLRTLVQSMGKDRLDRGDLERATETARELFGDDSDALSVLWQNRLLGYVERTPDGIRECFFSEVGSDHFALPLDREHYLLHSSMIDAVGVQPVGPPVGRLSTQEVTSRASSQRSRIGAYPVVGVIGSGGMGTVYLGEDLRLRRQVAIKVLPDDVPHDRDSLARLRREARLLAGLNHPNIATVYSFEEDDGLHFMTMEYVVGDTLDHRVRSGPLALDDALAVARQIAIALDCAHQQGVVHRDLKPSNVMVTDQGMVKVLDFGLAKVARQLGEAASTESWDGHGTSTGAIVGTLGYMSPEQLTGASVDHRADVWAFGCCLYECLTGSPAFGGASTPEQMVAIMERDPDWTALPGPDAVRELVMRCLVKAADRRLDEMSGAVAVIDGISLV